MAASNPFQTPANGFGFSFAAPGPANNPFQAPPLPSARQQIEDLQQQLRVLTAKLDVAEASCSVAKATNNEHEEEIQGVIGDLEGANRRIHLLEAELEKNRGDFNDLLTLHLKDHEWIEFAHEKIASLEQKAAAAIPAPHDGDLIDPRLLAPPIDAGSQSSAAAYSDAVTETPNYQNAGSQSPPTCYEGADAQTSTASYQNAATSTLPSSYVGADAQTSTAIYQNAATDNPFSSYEGVDAHTSTAAYKNAGTETFTASSQNASIGTPSPDYQDAGTDMADSPVHTSEILPEQIPSDREMLQEKCKSLEDENSALKHQVTKNEHYITHLEKQLKTAEKDIKAETMKASLFKNEIVACKVQEAKHTQYIEHLENQLSKEQKLVKNLEVISNQHNDLRVKYDQAVKDADYYKNKEASNSADAKIVYAAKEKLEKELAIAVKQVTQTSRDLADAVNLRAELDETREFLQAAYAQMEQMMTESPTFNPIPGANPAPEITEELNNTLNAALSNLDDSCHEDEESEYSGISPSGTSKPKTDRLEDMTCAVSSDSSVEMEETVSVANPHDGDAVFDEQGRKIVRVDGPAGETRIVELPIDRPVPGPAGAPPPPQVIIEYVDRPGTPPPPEIQIEYIDRPGTPPPPEIQIEYIDRPGTPPDPIVIRIPGRNVIHHKNWFTTDRDFFSFVFLCLDTMYGSIRFFIKMLRGTAYVDSEVSAFQDPAESESSDDATEELAESVMPMKELPQDTAAPLDGAGGAPAPLALETESFWTLRKPQSIKWTLFWFALHCLFYYLCWVLIDTYFERKMWRAANESTRAMLTDWLRNSSPSQGIFHGLLSPRWATWVDRSLLYLFQDLFNVQYQTYPMPG